MKVIYPCVIVCFFFLTYRGCDSQFTVTSPHDREEILWLARCIYSETKLKHEQKYVGWVVYNRLRSGKWGNTYKEVVLSPYQFSGFNQGHSKRSLHMTMGSRQGDQLKIGWKDAVDTATAIYYGRISNPFRPSALHFYSPALLSQPPSWAKYGRRVDIKENTRFVFYEGVP